MVARVGSFWRIALLAAVVLFAIVGLSSIMSIRRQSADAEWVAHTHEVLEQLETTLRFATEARRGAIGFVGTRDLRRLESCFLAHTQTESAIDRVDAVTRDNAVQQARVRTLRRLTAQEWTGFQSVANADAQTGMSIVQAPGWRARFDEIQKLIASMKADEQRLLALRSEEERSSARNAGLIVAGGEILAFALLAGALIAASREARQRQLAEAELERANQELTGRLSDLQRRSLELTLLRNLGQLLQSCETEEEAGAVVHTVFPKLFPNSRGAAFRIAPSRNLVSPIAAWPQDSRELRPFAPSECWALRSGTPHRMTTREATVACNHTEPSEASTICIPLLAHGETIGLLHICMEGGVEEGMEAGAAAAEQLGLALANLGMQETLRRQAMRDPLTGLFNRRYMEETLDREIHRAERRKSSIGVILLDLDHFKEYNDTLGHFAGDDLLRTAAGIMQRSVRSEDIVCRYGGDEFVIIMPEATAGIADERAQHLLRGLGGLPRPDATAAHPVTVSIGVAVYPVDAASSKELLLAADAALYASKRGGRSRVSRASRS